MDAAAHRPRPGDGLIVSYTSILGGAERLLLDLLPALQGGARLACPPGPLADAATAAGVRIEPLRPRRLELRGSVRDRVAAPARIAAQARELRGVVARLAPAWVVAWSMRPALSLATAFPRGGPPLLFQHNDFLPAGVAAGAVSAAARRADLVAALSHAVAHELDRHGRFGDRLVVSHPGVDLNRFAPTPPPAGRSDVLVLGALVDWKRPDLALEVAARVPGVRLVVAGAPIAASDPLSRRLRERAEQPDLAGRVEFTGRVSDPRPLLERAALLLHCSDREPFGLVVAEAFAAGRPVVAPAAGGPLEIVDESSGLLYPPGDAGAAAQAVTRLLGDRAALERMARSARSRAERHFGLAAARERFAALVGRLRAGA